MNIFDFRQQLIDDYAAYTRSFIQIRDQRLDHFVREQLDAGTLWPESLIQLNPSFEPGAAIDDLTRDGTLHSECSQVFRVKPDPASQGQPLRLHRHQTDAIQIARQGHPYVLTTGTGSGKSMSYIVPIVDHVLRRGSGRGIQAIVVYPMNALANSQLGELRKFLCNGFPDGRGPVTFERYTGQEQTAERDRILAQPPDILLTNYVMLELILTRPNERPLVAAAQGLQFLVLDELHTYRGRQGADVALLARRVRDALAATHLQCVGTSATLAGGGTFAEQQRVGLANKSEQLPLRLSSLTKWYAYFTDNSSDPALDELIRERTSLLSEQETKKDNLAQSLTEQGQRLGALQRVFGSLVSRVLSPEFLGTARIHDGEIECNITHGSVLAGEAVETLAVLLTDLTCLLLGTEQNCRHPGLHIHDSPREADLGGTHLPTLSGIHRRDPPTTRRPRLRPVSIHRDHHNGPTHRVANTRVLGGVAVERARQRIAVPPIARRTSTNGHTV